MKTTVQLVAISRDDATELFSENDLYAALNQQVADLEFTSGIRITTPEPRGAREAAGSELTVYLAEANYKGSLTELRQEIDEFNLRVLGGFDINFSPIALKNNERKLLVMDVDSTLIRQEVIDELADFAGRSAEVAAATERAMRGELDFEESLRERVSSLAGQPESIIDAVQERIFYTPGVRALVSAFLEADNAVAVVSGGFVQVLKPIAEDLRLTYARANLLDIEDGVLTGRVLGTVINATVKRESLKEWAKKEGISSEQIIAVGDGANDILMAEEAALGVAFNAKPAFAEVADARINTLRLDAVRYFAGL